MECDDSHDHLRSSPMVCETENEQMTGIVFTGTATTPPPLRENHTQMTVYVIHYTGLQPNHPPQTDQTMDGASDMAILSREIEYQHHKSQGDEERERKRAHVREMRVAHLNMLVQQQEAQKHDDLLDLAKSFQPPNETTQYWANRRPSYRGYNTRGNRGLTNRRYILPSREERLTNVEQGTAGSLGRARSYS